MNVIKPPTPLTLKYKDPTIFLAGSIDMGSAINWQTEVEQKLIDTNYNILNPRRDDWDSSWKQDINNPQFNEQVMWELRGMLIADYILMYFSPESKAPITLLELGLNHRNRNLFVCCPNGYWRKGNVDIVCREYNIKQVETLDDLINCVK